MGSIAGSRFYLAVASVFLFIGLFSLPGAAQTSPGEVILEKPQPTSELPGPEAKKEEVPTTCGPLISDTCIPIEEHHASLQVLWGLSLVRTFADNNWKSVNAGGNFGTFIMPVKFTFGPTKHLEIYTIAPLIVNYVNNATVPGPGGETSATYTGIGDISLFAKYLFIEEGKFAPWMPAVTAVFGTGFPTGHASHLNPRFLTVDEIGTGAFTFTTGVNLYKWLKPFLFYSNLWISTPVNIYPTNFSNIRSREYVTANLAVEYPFNKKWIGLVEFYSTWTWQPIVSAQGYQSPATLLGVLPGVEYFINDKWALSLGTAVDLAGKSTPLKVTPLFTVYYNF